MKVKAVIKKIEKTLGVKVQVTDNGRYYAHYDGRVLSFLGQGREGLGTGGVEADALNFHTRGETDYSDPQTDYFAGTFWDNATQMIHSVKPPEAKFQLGTLVEFKDNKRQVRYGNVGKVGIVVRANGRYLDVQIAGTGSVQTYISDRDLKAA
jgi:hypothetical protein